MKPNLIQYLTCLAIVGVLGYTSQVQAHSRWLVPSHTILSGEQAEVVALDFSISNDIFHPDVSFGGSLLYQKPLPPEATDPAIKAMQQKRRANMASQAGQAKVLVIAPDQMITQISDIADVGRKSVAAALLDQSGTYHIQVVQPPVLLTLYKGEDGKPAREFGSREQTQSLLPPGASDIKVLRVINTVDTYISRNQISDAVLKPSNSGLEMIFHSHPNEIFVGEQSNGTVLFNGKAVPANTELKIVRNDTRYRNQRNVKTVHTDAKGQFVIAWQTPGLYLVEVEYSPPQAAEGADLERYGVYTTLEVNPE